MIEDSGFLRELIEEEQNGVVEAVHERKIGYFEQLMRQLVFEEDQMRALLTMLEP